MDTIVVEDNGGVITTPLMWECECESVQEYLHMRGEQICPRCGMSQEDCPDARIEDVRALIEHHIALINREG